MTTPHINDSTPEAMKFLENARTRPARRKEPTEDNIPFERIPGLAYTHEERIASVRKGYEDSLAGRVISQEELEKEIRTWWQ